jgi:hypothetical protein
MAIFKHHIEEYRINNDSYLENYNLNQCSDKNCSDLKSNLDENKVIMKKPLRILIFNESFYPYTSGISRRFIEIITRLARNNFKIHLVTGTNVSVN